MKDLNQNRLICILHIEKERKKINIAMKQTQRYREQIDCHQVGGARGAGREKEEGLRSTNRQLQKQSWGCKVRPREDGQ